VVVIFEGAQWLPLQGCWVVQSDEANIDDDYDFETQTLIKTDIKFSG
jgi:hypothetical protein